MKGKLKYIDKSEIIDFYNNHSIKETTEKYNISSAMLYKLVNSLKAIKKYGRVHNFDQNYFEDINSPDKAYFLGWLYSDGNNFPSTGKIQLKLQINDVDILKLFAKYTNHNLQSISFNKRPIGKDQCTLRFCSMKMSKDLIEKGVVKAKSLILKFPDFIPDKLYNHFIRGIFDGDGCITSYLGKKDKNPNYQFIISGNRSIVEGVQNILVNKLQLSRNKLIENKSIFNLCYGGNKQVKKIYEWLYKDCEDLYLKRKKDKFEQLCKK